MDNTNIKIMYTVGSAENIDSGLLMPTLNFV
jgi:hypothetical protein